MLSSPPPPLACTCLLGKLNVVCACFFIICVGDFILGSGGLDNHMNVISLNMLKKLSLEWFFLLGFQKEETVQYNYVVSLSHLPCSAQGAPSRVTWSCCGLGLCSGPEMRALQDAAVQGHAQQGIGPLGVLWTRAFVHVRHVLQTFGVIFQASPNCVYFLILVVCAGDRAYSVHMSLLLCPEDI